MHGNVVDTASFPWTSLGKEGKKQERAKHTRKVEETIMFLSFFSFLFGCSPSLSLCFSFPFLFISFLVAALSFLSFFPFLFPKFQLQKPLSFHCSLKLSSLRIPITEILTLWVLLSFSFRFWLQLSFSPYHFQNSNRSLPLNFFLGTAFPHPLPWHVAIK